MSLSPGTRLGPYEIVAPLGAGGMGEVYRAKDTRLGRDVAVKVLPMHLSDNADIRTRFEREARTISSLNHPNICTLFDVGREGDMDYLVMELVDGDTLSDRLRKGPLTNAELLRFGTQIADALDRAHRAGVTHRDLKPGNVMLTKSGAKLMDFGLARASAAGGPVSGSGATMTALTHSPTVASPLTADGAIVGTFQYMSPEQLEGKEADARSDIWSLGCVLYEMATGRRAFEGRSQASLIAAILERPAPSVGETPSGASSAGGAPAGLDRLIRNCLAKDPDDRVQTAHDVKLQLQGIAEGAGMSAVSMPASSGTHAAVGARRAGSPLAWAIATAAALVAIAAVGWSLLHPAPPTRLVRFRVDFLPGTVWFGWPRVSPDGQYLLLQGADTSGTVRAYVRRLDQVEAVPVPGTEGLTRGYWSPDSREILFVADGKIQRAPLAGGSPTMIIAAPGGADLSWGSKGTILLDGQYADSMRAVPAAGGVLKPASRIDRAAGEVGSAWPSFLPDGEYFLFIGNCPIGSPHNHMRLGKLGTLDSHLLGDADSRVEYAPGGWVLFLRGTTLLTQKLDVSAGKLTGEPITLADHIATGTSNGHFSVSNSGVMAFKRDEGGDAAALVEVDRTGRPTGAPLFNAGMWNPQISTDGKRVLYQATASGTAALGEIHVFDRERATDTRLTFTGNLAGMPRWSPEGRRFAYLTRTARGASVIHIAASDGLGATDSIPVPSTQRATISQWSPVGSRLILTMGRHVSAVGSDDPARAFAWLPDSSDAFVPQVSPDGRWLAFGMGAPQNVHVYVRSLLGPPGRWQISTAIQGFIPYWTKAGRELVYEDWNGTIMAVDIDTKEGFHAGVPHALFKLPLASNNDDQRTWCCDPSGDHFYVLQPGGNRALGAVEVVTDFSSLVKRH